MPSIGNFCNISKAIGDHSKCFQGEPKNKDHTPEHLTQVGTIHISISPIIP